MILSDRRRDAFEWGWRFIAEAKMSLHYNVCNFTWGFFQGLISLLYGVASSILVLLISQWCLQRGEGSFGSVVPYKQNKQQQKKSERDADVEIGLEDRVCPMPLHSLPLSPPSFSLLSPLRSVVRTPFLSGAGTLREWNGRSCPQWERALFGPRPGAGSPRNDTVC